MSWKIYKGDALHGIWRYMRFQNHIWREVQSSKRTVLKYELCIILPCISVTSMLLFSCFFNLPAQTQIQILRFLKHIGTGYASIISHFWHTFCENWLNWSLKHAITQMRIRKFPCGHNLGPEGLLRIKVFLTMEDNLN